MKPKYDLEAHLAKLRRPRTEETKQKISAALKSYYRGGRQSQAFDSKEESNQENQS